MVSSAVREAASGLVDGIHTPDILITPNFLSARLYSAQRCGSGKSGNINALKITPSHRRENGNYNKIKSRNEPNKAIQDELVNGCSQLQRLLGTV